MARSPWSRLAEAFQGGAEGPPLRLTFDELRALHELVQAGLKTAYRQPGADRGLYDRVSGKVSFALHTDPKEEA